MEITRQEIISVLENALKENSSVYAFWLEGADAHDKVDDYSDIDMWFDVEDGHEEEVLTKISDTLFTLSPIDFEHETKHSHSKIRQKFFHVEGTSEFLIVDVCIQSHSRDIWLVKENVDEKVQIIFEKEQVIKYKDLDIPKFQNTIQERVDELEKTYIFYQAWVKKGIARGNFLEALKYYHEYVLAPLVEILRIKHEPTKHSYGLKHIEQDLPRATLEKIEDLYKINSLSEMSEKIERATQLFFEVVKSLKNQ